MKTRTLRVPVDFFERFLAQVRRGQALECWTWIGAIAPSGYGALNCRELFGKETQLAHRVSYWMWKGKIPRGLCLDHTCGNRQCVNPAHLQAVPSAVNSRRGKATKLTGAQVRQIRARYIPHVTKQGKLAKEYGVHPAHISRIVNKKLWREIHASFERV